MGKVFLVFLLLFLLLLFLSLTTVRVQVNYARQDGEYRFTLGISAWGGLIKYYFALPGPSLKRKMRWPSIRLKKKDYTGLLKQARLRRLSWHTEIGAGDPSCTSLLTGAVWGLKGVIIAAFYRLFSPDGAAPLVEVRPSFNQECFNTAIECALEVRLGHLVLTGIKVLPGLVAARKKTR